MTRGTVAKCHARSRWTLAWRKRVRGEDVPDDRQGVAQRSFDLMFDQLVEFRRQTSHLESRREKENLLFTLFARHVEKTLVTIAFFQQFNQRVKSLTSLKKFIDMMKILV